MNIWENIKEIYWKYIVFKLHIIYVSCFKNNRTPFSEYLYISDISSIFLWEKGLKEKCLKVNFLRRKNPSIKYKCSTDCSRSITNALLFTCKWLISKITQVLYFRNKFIQEKNFAFMFFQAAAFYERKKWRIFSF